MATADPHRIATLDALRAIVGEASPVVQVKLWSTLEPAAQAFIARSPLILLATADTGGRMDVSPKGDGPGFVAVDDDGRLLIPDRKGNKLVFGLQNILDTGRVGIIFLVPGTTETLRVNGRAELTADPAVCARLAARGQAALLAIRVTVEECFFHCGKALLRAALWKPETWPTDMRVSFGKMLAPNFGGGEVLEQQIDAAIEDDYRTNL